MPLRDFFRFVEPGRIWMEFGVASGTTLREIAEHTPGLVYGFDSFDGLPEDWLIDSRMLHHPKGTFKCGMPTNLPANVRLVIGLFEKKLPKFLESHDIKKLGFVHIDCDLYSSTKFVLDQLVLGFDDTVIAFDEIIGEEANDQHEGRAWREFIESHPELHAEFLGNQHAYGQVFKLST